ncbi:MAG: YcxB family protein [Chitinophagaceae bacterium]|jgi:hypothetical protein|nr:YcxB family protein [Chitinophagaceae bacterium]
MQHFFSYDKKKVIQGLRYHFISRSEIKFLIILVNVFAIISGVLFYMKKIRPEPFLLSSVMWLILMVTFWYILPATIYKKSKTFQDSFTINFSDTGIRLQTSRGAVDWAWNEIQSYMESPNFFHLYFTPRSFFLVSKDGMSSDCTHQVRALVNKYVKKG